MRFQLKKGGQYKKSVDFILQIQPKTVGSRRVKIIPASDIDEIGLYGIFMFPLTLENSFI